MAQLSSTQGFGLLGRVLLYWVVLAPLLMLISAYMRTALPDEALRTSLEAILTTCTMWIAPLMLLPTGRAHLCRSLHPIQWVDWLGLRRWGVPLWGIIGGLSLATWGCITLTLPWMEHLASLLGFETTDHIAVRIGAYIAEGGLPALLIAINVCLLAPLAEELFFRGFVLRTLVATSPLSRAQALILSSALFAIVHLSFVGMPGRFMIGWLLGYVYLSTRRLSVAIGLHILNNVIGLIGLYY